MPPKLQILGQKFGRLTVVAEAHNPNKSGTYWDCDCDCGGKALMAPGNMLTFGHKTSCGSSEDRKVQSGARTHGLSSTLFYKRWQAIKTRCENKNSESYQNYGGRGISLCKRWQDFAKFYEDLYPSFLNHVKKYGMKDTSLERENNNKGYSPSNCVWATKKEQAQNTRRNRIISFDGKSMSVMEWSRLLGIGHGAIKHRLNSGWSIKDTLTKPTKNRK